MFLLGLGRMFFIIIFLLSKKKIKPLLHHFLNLTSAFGASFYHERTLHEDCITKIESYSNSTPMELPNGLSPPPLHQCSRGIYEVHGFWFSNNTLIHFSFFQFKELVLQNRGKCITYDLLIIFISSSSFGNPKLR